jgi:hypothetical protein
MGSKTSKEERLQREQVKSATFERAKENVRDNARIQKEAQTRALIPHDPFASTIQQAKIHQLDRKGRPFTKADLVGLLCRLKHEDENGTTLLQYQALSCDDLRAYIRLIVYAPDTLSPEQNGNKGGGNPQHQQIEEVQGVIQDVPGVVVRRGVPPENKMQPLAYLPVSNYVNDDQPVSNYVNDDQPVSYMDQPGYFPSAPNVIPSAPEGEADIYVPTNATYAPPFIATGTTS